MMKRKLIFLIPAIFFLLTILFFHHYYKNKKNKITLPPSAQPAFVEAQFPNYITWKTKIHATGIAKAAQGAILSAPESTSVTEINFTADQVVKAGDVLIEFNNATEKAASDDLSAKYQLAQEQLARYQEAYKVFAVSKNDLDVATAQVKEIHAQIETAKANLNNKEIIAPYDGVVGIPEVSVGEFVQAGQPIVSIENTAPLDVDFYLGEKYYPEIKLNQSVNLSTEALNERMSGKIIGIDPQLNNETHTFDVRVRADESNKYLSPGMSVQVDFEASHLEKVFSISQTALIYSPNGDEVFTLDNNNITHLKKIRIVELKANSALISGDLLRAERIVTAGQNNLYDGMRVTIVNGN